MGPSDAQTPGETSPECLSKKTPDVETSGGKFMIQIIFSSYRYSQHQQFWELMI